MTFLPDLIPECVEVTLMAGQTMFIPSGWIHGVYTPADSIVIGGNFLHIYGMSMQLQIYQIEEDTNVAQM
jgi:F-box/leucine-rich repeat protein 10/11